MWLAAIKAGNYATCPGLTYENAKTYHPTTEETLKGHMTQTRQGVRSNKQNSTSSKPTWSVSPLPNNVPAKTSNKLYVVVMPVSKLYSDDMGRFPICSRSVHRYIMLAFHCNSNVIPIEPFQYRHDRHPISAYSLVMARIQDRGHEVDLQVLDNKASTKYCHAITQTWKEKFQLVPPDGHRRNAAERAIRTFKGAFSCNSSGR